MMCDTTAYLKMSFGIGNDFTACAEKALKIGKLLDVHVEYTFNNKDCTVCSNRDDVEGMLDMYMNDCKWCHN